MKPKIPASAPKPKSKPKPAGTRSSGSSRSSSSRSEPTGWAVDLLGTLGMPVTPDNVRFLNAWAQAEGSRAAFNPLATTQPASGASSFNSVGVRNYTSYEQGLQATAQTLRNGNYGGILSALRSGTSAVSAAQAVAASPWGTGSGVLRVLNAGGGGSAPQISGVGRRGMSAPVGGGSGTATYNMGPDATTLDPQVLAQDFGYAAAFYNSDPSLKALIDRAVSEHWDPQGNRFAAELMGTDWYKKHDAAQRKWIQLTTSDPAEAERQQQQMLHDIGTQARQMGVPLGTGRATQIAQSALKFGWSSAEVQQAISAEYRYKPNQTPMGSAGSVIDTMNQLSAAYVVPISDQAKQDWTKKVLSGEATADQYAEVMKRYAKSMFPELSPQIDAGMTVSQYLDPYKQVAAQMLEINPSEVNWLDPKWSQAVFQVDPKTGQRGAMSLAQWQNTLRTDPKYGFDQTTQARTDAADLSSKIQQLMGSLG